MKSRRPRKPGHVIRINAPTPAALGRAIAQAIHAQEAAAATTAKGQPTSC